MWICQRWCGALHASLPLPDSLAHTSQGQTGQLRAAIQAHRASFVNESDFTDLAASGINAVRLPIGYWALEATAVRNMGPAAPRFCSLLCAACGFGGRLEGVKQPR